MARRRRGRLDDRIGAGVRGKAPARSATDRVPSRSAAGGSNGTRRGRRKDSTEAQAAADREAVEGRVPKTEDGARRRADPARACARTTSSSPLATLPSARTSSSSAGSPASLPTSTRRWRSPRTPGSSWRSGLRDRPDRSDRTDRLRKIDRRALARQNGQAWSSSMPTSSLVTCSRPANRPSTRSWRGSGRRWSDRTARSTGRRSAASCSPTRRRSGTSRRSSIQPSGRAFSPRSPTPPNAGASAVVIEAIKLVEGGLAALCDEVWLVRCERGRPAWPADRPRDKRRRRRQRIEAQAGFEDRVRAGGDARARYVGRCRGDTATRRRRLRRSARRRHWLTASRGGPAGVALSVGCFARPLGSNFFAVRTFFVRSALSAACL